MKERVHVFASGLVQGVCYRANVRREAEKRHLNGWVRNLDDGRVEAIFEGDEHKVKEIVDYCRKGPSGAKVDNVEAYPDNGDEKLAGFEVR